MPNNATTKSSGASKIRALKMLPEKAQLTHGFKTIKQNLLSTGQLCDVGCIAEFHKETCIIRHENKTMLTGPRNKKTDYGQSI